MGEKGTEERRARRLQVIGLWQDTLTESGESRLPACPQGWGTTATIRTIWIEKGRMARMVPRPINWEGGKSEKQEGHGKQV